MSPLEQIDHLMSQYELAHYGVAALETPVSLESYRKWLDNRYHGNMSYLEEHFMKKQHPNQLLPRAKTAIVITENYVPHPHPMSLPFKTAQVALYAQGHDYHHWLKKKLQDLCDELKEKFPQEDFEPFVDSQPVLERDLAYRAGLGWIGKNTCLLHRQKGSLMFIGEVYTTLSLPVAELTTPDHCGTCTKCIEICPTQAFVEPKNLDARKCISYLTIEHKGPIDEKLMPHMQNWIFGCDLCQTICPWNKDHIISTTQLSAENQKQNLINELKDLLQASNKQIQKQIKGTALLRAGAKSLKRNAMIVAANEGLTELIPEIQSYLENEDLKSTAGWSLDQLNAKLLK